MLENFQMVSEKLSGKCRARGNGDVRSSPWGAKDTQPTCPTPSGSASKPTFLTPASEGAPGRTARGRSSTPSSICSKERLSLETTAPRLRTPWKSVYDWFRKWRIDGTFEHLNTALRERLRTRSGRNPQPSAGIVDSQSAKSTGVGGEQRGYDGGKKIRGRKRHLLVDTEGLVMNEGEGPQRKGS